MKPVFVRSARKDESDRFKEWALANAEKNGLDLGVLTYPSTTVLCAFDETGPLAYLPVQQPAFMESLAPRPGLTDHDRAMVFKALTQTLVTQCASSGKGEIYFLASDKDTAEFAENHKFEKVPYAVYRLKLKDLGIER
jgi:hypothetical protein